MTIKTTIAELERNHLIKYSEAGVFYPTDGYMILHNGETILQIETVARPEFNEVLIITERGIEHLGEYIVENSFEVKIWREMSAESLC